MRMAKRNSPTVMSHFYAWGLFFSIFFMEAYQSRSLPLSVVEGEERILQRELREEEGIIQPIVCRQSMKDRSADCSSQQLYTVPQNLFPDIEILILTSNWISRLMPPLFQRYVQLRVLYLDRNRLGFIMRETFYSLRHLEKFVLADGALVPLWPRELQFSYNLKYLDQSLNPVALRTFQMISYLPKLEYFILRTCRRLTDITIPPCNGKREKLVIDVSDNHIDVLSPENVFFGCQADSLILDGNPLSRIEPVTIASLPVRSLSLGNKRRPPAILKSLFLGVSMSGIEELVIRNAGITDIPADMFHPLQNKSLSLLDLSGNNLILRSFVFSSLSFVSTLLIVDSAFTAIEPEYFYGMNSLSNLTLSSDTLTDIFASLYRYSVELTSLEIHTPLRKDGELSFCLLEPFDWLQNLKILKFIDRDLRIPICECYNFFLALPTVEHVSFGISRGKYNLILDIPNAKEIVFYAVENAKDAQFQFQLLPRRTGFMLPEKISLLNAGIRKTNLFEDHITNRTMYLNMSRNHVKVIPAGDFNNYSSLETLDLKQNIISTIASDAFVGLVSLKRLFLEHNRLIYLSPNTFKTLIYLESLHLDHNNLYYLDEKLFADTSVLTTLTVSHNNVGDFNRNTFDMIRSSVQIIDISHNVITCNCDSMWLVVEFGEIININNTVCSMQSQTLDRLRGRPLSMFVPNYYCHSSIAYAFLLISFVVTLVSLVAYRKSYRLKYQFYLVKLAILGYTEISDAHDMDDFDYDINIMFSYQTKEWASEQFKPILQERLPNFNRIAFDDDDLTLGRHYLDAVYTNVEKSFKVVLLLNKDAVQDHIFMTKFRIAMNHVTDTKTENMVLVFLETIPEDELPYLVRLYLTGQGEHILWEENEEGQDYFWYKFERFMRVNLKINHMVPPE